jgi:hypothetical protein
MGCICGYGLTVKKWGYLQVEKISGFFGFFVDIYYICLI